MQPAGAGTREASSRRDGPYTYIIIPCFEKQGGIPVVDAQTYLFYMETVNRRSRPSENIWVPYNDETEQGIVADFKRLWATNFLDDLSIEVRDVRFENGVIGKVILYNMEERQRVKIVDYIGSDKVDQSKIEEELRDKGIQIRLDRSSIRGRSAASPDRPRAVCRQGGMFAEVKPEIKEVAGARRRSTSPSTSPKGRRSRSASSSSSATRRSAITRCPGG